MCKTNAFSEPVQLGHILVHFLNQGKKAMLCFLIMNFPIRKQKRMRQKLKQGVTIQLSFSGKV